MNSTVNFAASILLPANMMGNPAAVSKATLARTVSCGIQENLVLDVILPPTTTQAYGIFNSLSA